jgi:signal transduction histidine kinase
MHPASQPNATPYRNYGLVSSRIAKMMIRVAEASGIPLAVITEQTGLLSPAGLLLRDDMSLPWNDLVTLADRIAMHYGNDPDSMVDFGRSYYRHLEHLPYTRLATTILTLRGALHISQKYTTPHNYEALICTSRWISRTEGVKNNRLKYAADRHSEPICHITRGILEHFPTLFGRDPMSKVEMDIGERDVIYHFTLPPRIGARRYVSRAINALWPFEKKWQILKEQEARLVDSRMDSHRRQRILDELLSQAPQALVLLENGKPVFSNRAVSQLVGGADGASRIPFGEIYKRLHGYETLVRHKFSITAEDGSALPLEAILTARLAAESFGNEMALLRLRDRREPETLDQAVSIGREHERIALARDLHDGLGQTLSGIAYRLAAMRQSLPDNKLLTELEHAIRFALAQARTIAHKINEPGAMPLAEKLSLTVSGFSGLTQIAIRFECLLPDPALRFPAAHEFDMILREALANAVRHSRAKSIGVCLSAADSTLVLEVRDDGKGLPEQYMPGFGISSIRARVALMKGAVTWLNISPGTLLRCTVPHPMETI